MTLREAASPSADALSRMAFRSPVKKASNGRRRCILRTVRSSGVFTVPHQRAHLLQFEEHQETGGVAGIGIRRCLAAAEIV